jgi:3-oxoacyl-[acyl-carrier protein] reductase
MSKRFAGKTVLVTGAADGLGRAYALAFAREGADQIIVDIEPKGLAESTRQIEALGVQCASFRVDLSVESEIHQCAAEVCRRWPRLDVLINNAGLAYGEISTGFAELSQAKWLKFLSINTLAPLLLAQALRVPLAAAQGLIINQSSMASYVPATAYGITKSALNAMTFGMAYQFGADGIRVNGIAPGIMSTPASDQSLSPEQKARVQGMQLIKGQGTAEDIAQLGVFLASTEGRFINNDVISCDAGNRMRGYRG